MFTQKHILALSVGFVLAVGAISPVAAAPGPPTGGGDFGAFGQNTGDNTTGGDRGDFGGLIGIEGTPPAGQGRTGTPDASVDPANPTDCADGTCVPLLAPLGNKNIIEVTSVAPGSGADSAVAMFVDYFATALPLIRITSIGFCVLWILIGSFYVMVSGSDGGKRTKGKEIIMWAVIGLVITEFAAFFLKTLNNIFFI